MDYFPLSLTEDRDQIDRQRLDRVGQAKFITTLELNNTQKGDIQIDIIYKQRDVCLTDRYINRQIDRSLTASSTSQTDKRLNSRVINPHNSQYSQQAFIFEAILKMKKKKKDEFPKEKLTKGCLRMTSCVLSCF